MAIVLKHLQIIPKQKNRNNKINCGCVFRAVRIRIGCDASEKGQLELIACLFIGSTRNVFAASVAYIYVKEILYLAVAAYSLAIIFY